MSRLSLPLSTDYKVNVVSPGTQQFPPSQEASGGDEPRTFATFGKAAGEEPVAAEPPLANSFLSEMNTLLGMILSQKANSHTDVSLELWHRLSVCNRTLELDGVEAAGSKETVSGLGV